ncbi:hypothetical protein NLU13_3756 [Sarocladium strictum]|uniref:CCHC-type domain-containing protein n=1 Tax=Sarocladium strictum TaxID=5046 RepID=A0AA39GHM5_SARSR|nr:hypothetical protein NLU13_3756 [Sarocladium strictum]
MYQNMGLHGFWPPGQTAYPGMPSAYPGMPSAYPGVPAAYPAASTSYMGPGVATPSATEASSSSSRSGVQLADRITRPFSRGRSGRPRSRSPRRRDSIYGGVRKQTSTKPELLSQARSKGSRDFHPTVFKSGALPKLLKSTPRKTCGHCGQDGHVLAICAWPREDGYVHGCPHCNVTSHSLTDCPAQGLRNSRHNLKQQVKLYYGIDCRQNRPPLASLPDWDAKGYPWTPSKAGEFFRSQFAPWQNLDYNQQKTMPVDPATKDFHTVAALYWKLERLPRPVLGSELLPELDNVTNDTFQLGLVEDPGTLDRDVEMTSSTDEVTWVTSDPDNPQDEPAPGMEPT